MLPAPLRLVLPALALLLAACGTQRQEALPAELHARLESAGVAHRALVDGVTARMLARLDAALAAGRDPVINVLMLSGGAEWGAFGAGFLHAWSRIPAPDPRAMPEFDLVTGISTGALIAPYALIGDSAALARVDDLYRTCRPAYAQRRLWGFLGEKRGFYDIGELEAAIRADLVSTVAPGLGRLADRNRAAVVAAADLDLGLLRLWDLTREAATLDRLFTIQRAAIAIPGAFDPVEIDGALYADAGVLMQFIALADPEALASALGRWNAVHPATPARLRQWIIINNKPHEPLRTIQPRWTDSLPRSMALMVKSGVVGPLTAISLQADLLRRQGFDVEVRWIAIPPDLAIDPEMPPFDERVTVPLSDLGRRLGAEQSAWRTAPPRFAERESGAFSP